MEACATSHYWAREIAALGHEVRLMPPKYVKAYLKRQKNDAADAAAICEAVGRPDMRFVPVKSRDQQAVLMLHRARDLRSSSAGAYLGLTPRRYESGEISRNGRVSKRGDGFTRKCLFEAANAIFCRNLGGPRLRDWAKVIAERTGPRKAKVALPGSWWSPCTPCGAPTRPSGRS